MQGTNSRTLSEDQRLDSNNKLFITQNKRYADNVTVDRTHLIVIILNSAKGSQVTGCFGVEN